MVLYEIDKDYNDCFLLQSNAESIKAAGSSRGRRHNVRMKPSDTERPSVEYTRGATEDDGKCKSV